MAEYRSISMFEKVNMIEEILQLAQRITAALPGKVIPIVCYEIDMGAGDGKKRKANGQGTPLH